MPKQAVFTIVYDRSKNILKVYNAGMDVKADCDESYYLDTLTSRGYIRCKELGFV